MTLTEDSSKKCMIDFQKKNCNALKLEGEENENCRELFDCIKKDGENEITSILMYLVSIGMNEIKESALLPALSILMLMVYQITKALNRRGQAEFSD